MFFNEIFYEINFFVAIMFSIIELNIARLAARPGIIINIFFLGGEAHRNIKKAGPCTLIGHTIIIIIK